MSILNDMYIILRNLDFPNEVLNESLLKAQKNIDIRMAIQIYLDNIEVFVEENLKEKNSKLKELKNLTIKDFIIEEEEIKKEQKIAKKLYDEFHKFKNKLNETIKDVDDVDLKKD